MQRYKIQCHEWAPEFILHPAGKWVKYSDVENLCAELLEYQQEVRWLTQVLRRIYCVDAEWSTPPTKSVAERMHDIDTAALLLKARKGKGE